MKSKPIVARERANLDVDAAIDYYLSEDAVQAAMGFIDALERAYAHIGRYPATGSSRYGHELNLPRLRSWKLKRYPYLIFYLSAKIPSTSGECFTASGTSLHGWARSRERAKFRSSVGQGLTLRGLDLLRDGLQNPRSALD